MKFAAHQPASGFDRRSHDGRCDSPFREGFGSPDASSRAASTAGLVRGRRSTEADTKARVPLSNASAEAA
jgi:hypothetical protein